MVEWTRHWEAAQEYMLDHGIHPGGGTAMNTNDKVWCNVHKSTHAPDKDFFGSEGRVARCGPHDWQDKGIMMDFTLTQEARERNPDIDRKRAAGTRPLGYFDVHSGLINITDPCYPQGTWCAAWDVPAVDGHWFAEVTYQDHGKWGVRPMLLVAYLGERPNEGWTEVNEEIGVDSGQAGFFDSQYYRTDASFYDDAASLTLSPQGAGVMEHGVVSSSGFGDGGYVAHVHKNEDGIVTAVKIDFGYEE